MDVQRSPSFRLTGRRALFSMLLAIAWTAGMTVVPVAGDAGNVGEHSTMVTCWGTTGQIRWMAVETPEIWASFIDHPGFNLGGQHVQWALFRAHLMYSPDQVNWQYVTSGPWFAAQVGDSANTLKQQSWWNYDTQQNEIPVSANTWPLNWRGFYRAAVEYFWKGDEYTGSGYAYAWADGYDDFYAVNPVTSSCLGAL